MQAPTTQPMSERTVTAHGLRVADPDSARDAATLARLHLALVGHGPMARLGETFLSRFCYSMLIRDGLMKAAVYEVDGEAAGFVAYTTRSYTFHRAALGKRWPSVAYLVAREVVCNPRVLGYLFKAVWLMFSRRAEKTQGQDPSAEVLGIGVLPQYCSAAFVRRTGIRISPALVAHAAEHFRGAGLGRMRMIVEEHNKPALLFYHSLGASFEPYAQAGEPMVQVWLDIADALATRGAGER